MVNSIMTRTLRALVPLILLGMTCVAPAMASDVPAGPIPVTGGDSLRFVAQCTLRRGAIVVIGAGQSVSAETCGEPRGREQYPANARDFQVYIHAAWTKTGTPDAMLSCPDESQDYRNDPNDISKSY